MSNDLRVRQVYTKVAKATGNLNIIDSWMGAIVLDRTQLISDELDKMESLINEIVDKSHEMANVVYNAYTSDK